MDREQEEKNNAIVQEIYDRLHDIQLQQRAILNNIPDIVWLKDKESRFIEVNEAFGAACGFSPEEIVGKTDLDIWPKELAESYRADDREVMNSRKRKCVEERLADKQGQIQWIETIKTPVFDNKGEVVGTTGIARDITERKKIEERLKEIRAELEIRVKVRTVELTRANEDLRKEISERKKSDEALRLSEERFRTKTLELEVESRKAAQLQANTLRQQLEFILRATKTELVIIDKDFYIRYIDPERLRKYGDWAGKKCFDYFMASKNPCPRCSIEKALKTKKIVVSEEALAKEGNRTVQVTTIPFQNENGEWLIAEVNMDISERKKIDDELWRYREHLEELVEERSGQLMQEISLHKKAEVEKSKLNYALLKSYEKLKSISLIDAHTGLYNHRYLQDVIEAEFHQSKRYAQHLSVIMLDIDYFKSINDVYGMAFGGLVLKQLAKQLRRLVRRYDILIRYSGEEFIIISPRLNRELALNMAQRLLESLNITSFGNKHHTVKLKLSLSAVSYPEDRATKGIDLVNLANNVLDRAKESGGNRAYSSLDIKKPPKKGMERILKVSGVKTLKNTIEKLTKKSKQGLVESILAFAKTIELKDHYTGEHVESTVHYATEIAKELAFGREEIELIKQAAMLHDLGKIGISENILLKKGKLSKKEFNEIKKHPQIGADIIRPIQFLHGLIPFIFYHHERWDGKGYPSGIKGEDIPVGARIIAIADVYQALTSDRPYHKAFSKKQAIEIIKKASGTQFDPHIANIFLKIIKKEK